MIRGYHPKDIESFSATECLKLQQCLADAVYLVNRGYPLPGLIRFTAGHYSCDSRQILMLTRAICSDRSLEIKTAKKLNPEELKGRTLFIDGFNIIITLEVLFSKGTLFVGRDRCVRDIPGLRGNYKIINETSLAVELLAKAINQLEISKAIIYLDSPVSNSGKLKSFILERSGLFDCSIEIEIIHNPDIQLYGKGVVVTAEGIILENCECWFNMGQYALGLLNQKLTIDFSKD